MSVFKKIATLLSGSVIAQLLTLLSYPILTRWLQAEQWATLGIFSAFVAVASVWACGGLESTILLPKSNNEARALLKITRRWSIYLGSLAVLVLIVWIGLNDVFWSPYAFQAMLFTTGLSVYLEGRIVALMQWHNRMQDFNVMAKSRFIQSSVTLVFSVVLAIYVTNVNGILVYAWVIGQLFAYSWLSYQLHQQEVRLNILPSPMHIAFAAYAHFPKWSMFSSMLNVISRQLPFFVLPFLGGPVVMGHFAFAYKLLTAPISFIGASLTQVFNVKSSNLTNDGSTVHQWTKKWRDIFIGTSVFPLVALIFFGPPVFAFVFGSEYAQAGVYAAYLTPWIFMLYWINPLSHLINVHGVLKQHAFYNIIVLIARSTALVVVGYLFGFDWALISFGVVGFAAASYMAYWLWSLSLVSNSRTDDELPIEQKSLEIIFTGDFAATGSFVKRIKNGEEIWDDQIQNLFENAAATVVNWEGPIAEYNENRKQGEAIIQPIEALDFCMNRKINVFNLANNHIHDLGITGASNTCKEILNRGEMNLGVNETGQWDWTPQYICLNGVTVALLAIHEDEKKIDLHSFRQQLKQIRPSVDYIVLQYHGGEEYSSIPFPFKRRRLLKLIQEDVDAIVAHHPHVVQPFQQIGKKWIFYSLGNFIFDIDEQRNKALIEKGILLSLSFSKQVIIPRIHSILSDSINAYVSISDDEYVHSLNHRWQSEEYGFLWTEECTRIRAEERLLTHSIVSSNTSNISSGLGKTKWQSLFNPTRRTLFIGDFIHRIFYLKGNA